MFSLNLNVSFIFGIIQRQRTQADLIEPRA